MARLNWLTTILPIGPTNKPIEYAERPDWVQNVEKNRFDQVWDKNWWLVVSVFYNDFQHFKRGNSSWLGGNELDG